MHFMYVFVLFYVHPFSVGWKFRRTSENVCKARTRSWEFQIEKEFNHHLLNLSQKFIVQQNTITERIGKYCSASVIIEP